ncbi:hypothetical protein [Cryptosporangium phraense]|uniref:Uncharacterized protein n=1 Tax=Cryptosporangium phraense TaxID=2593070 RepID=A0A545ARM0_9ACTN|nr:hypothetical protein [Cryptosporangium phraense]TQS43970.1 hypothetical protein FL583_16040 [Cryptosporangium phraense]
MAPRSGRLTVAQFVREIFDQRTPLLYSVAIVLGGSKAADTYSATANVPEALLLGAVSGATTFVFMCTITWFVLRLRSL